MCHLRLRLDIVKQQEISFNNWISMKFHWQMFLNALFLWMYYLLISWVNFYSCSYMVLFYLIFLYFLCKFYLWSSTLKMWNRSNRATNSRSSTQASKTLSSPALVSVNDSIVITFIVNVIVIVVEMSKTSLSKVFLIDIC